jgi:hypothetical protein
VLLVPVLMKLPAAEPKKLLVGLLLTLISTFCVPALLLILRAEVFLVIVFIDVMVTVPLKADEGVNVTPAVVEDWMICV